MELADRPGCVIDRKERPPCTGTKMAWVRLSDASGSCEVTFFSEVLSRTRDLRREGEMLRVMAQDAVSLD